MDLYTYWEGFLELLLPSNTFEKSPARTRDKHLRTARFLIFVFYVGLGYLTLVLFCNLLFSGRRSVTESYYKVDTLEAPSIAICPFNPKTAIIKPANASVPIVNVYKYTSSDVRKRNLTTRDCVFDRTCVCVDVSPFTLRDQVVLYRTNSGFQERIEVNTTLQDPSPFPVLKFGFYDTVDTTPMWFYATQGAIVYGQLELQKWTLVRAFTLAGIKAFFHGDVQAFKDQRHLFHYTSQEVGVEQATARSDIQTSMSYEMRHFFIQETTTSDRAFSIFTFFNLLILIFSRTALINLFMDSIFPKWRDPASGPILRELSWQASIAESFLDSAKDCLCCCCPSREETLESTGERTPLV